MPTAKNPEMRVLLLPPRKCLQQPRRVETEVIPCHLGAEKVDVHSAGAHA